MRQQRNEFKYAHIQSKYANTTELPLKKNTGIGITKMHADSQQDLEFLLKCHKDIHEAPRVLQAPVSPLLFLLLAYHRITYKNFQPLAAIFVPALDH